MNQWEIKQILDLTSKGVNSVLMNRPAKQRELKALAEFLEKLYTGIIKRLKDQEASPELKKPIETKDEVIKDALKDEKGNPTPFK